MRYCSDCGQEVEPADDYCFACGAALDTAVAGRVHSLTTVWVAGVLAFFGLLEATMLLFFTDSFLTQAEQFDVGGDLSPTILLVYGALRLVFSLAVVALCYYYYSLEYVERRFFWALVGFGVAGFFLAGSLSFLILGILGLYGVFILMR